MSKSISMQAPTHIEPSPTAQRDAPVNILLVDDETSNLTALEAVLDDPAYRLVRAASGEQALLALVDHDFACLLLDVRMPGMTGFELARTIATRRKNARTPIIFLTAHCHDDEDALEGYASGGVDYLLKPFHPAVLRQKVEIFADLHRAQRRLQLQAEADCADVAEENARLAAAVQDAEQRKDKFLAMLAHELRNPLAPISNAVQIIRGQAAPPATVQWACDVIGRQASQMARLIDDLLDVARLMQGKVAMTRQPVTLATLVERAVETSAPQAQQRRQSIQVQLPGEAIAIQGDAARLVQAIANVVNNASKFSGPDTTIRIEAAYGKGEVHITVQDAGTGIAPELLPHVFDLFAQGEQSLDRPQGGLGVGLTLVRHVVELHGGSVVARSSGAGQGTEVAIRLPAQASARGDATGAPAPIAGRATGAAGTTPVRVLVVDDEVASAETLMALLEIKGFEVRTAHDGVTALDAAEAFLPDVVLLDIGLPGMNGFEVAQHLRTQPHLRQALLIALTGYGDAETRARAAQAGFDSHMTKPADMDRLLPLLADPRAAKRSRH